MRLAVDATLTWVRRGGFVGLLVLCGPAQAETPTERAIRLYHEATVHYNLGQYKLAVDELTAAVHADPTLPGAYRNLGLTYRAMGKCDMALPNFRKYLQLQPLGKHAQRVKREIERCVNAVREEGSVAPVGAAQLVLRVSEDGAQVRIDGVLRGATPIGALPVQPGRHAITVSREGFVPWSGVVEVVEGQVAAVNVALKVDPAVSQARQALLARQKQREASRGILKVVGAPHGSQLTADGVPLRLDDDQKVFVEAGTRRVGITHSGYLAWSGDVTIRAHAMTTIVSALQPSQKTRTLRRWGWGLTAGALALGLAGGVLGFLESRTFDEIQDYDRGNGTRAALDDLSRRRRDQALAANILYGFAAAAFGTAIILFAITPDTERPAYRTSQ